MQIGLDRQVTGVHHSGGRQGQIGSLETQLLDALLTHRRVPIERSEGKSAGGQTHLTTQLAQLQVQTLAQWALLIGECENNTTGSLGRRLSQGDSHSGDKEQ